MLNSNLMPILLGLQKKLICSFLKEYVQPGHHNDRGKRKKKGSGITWAQGALSFLFTCI